MARRSVVELILQAKDAATPTIRNVSQASGGLGREIRKAAIGVGALGAAFAALRTAGAVVDMARASDEAQRLEESFERLAANADDSAAGMLSAMKRMSQGAISESDLILSANRAMMLGVADSGEELSKLLEVAIERGSAMGLSAQQAFNDLVTGIGRMSPLILDNLGIVTGGEAVFEAYAQSIGKATSELSDAEKKMALLNVVTAETDGVIDASVSSFERYQVAVSEARVAIGELTAPGVIAGLESITGIINKAVESLKSGAVAQASLNELAGSLQRLGERSQRLEAELSKLSPTTDAYWRKADQLAQTNDTLARTQETYIARLQQANGVQSAAAAALNRTSMEAQFAAQSLDQMTAATERLSYGATALQYSLGQSFTPQWLATAQASINSMAASLSGDLGAGGAVAFAENSIDAVRRQRREWQEQGYDIDHINNILLPGYIASLDDGVRKTAQLGQATASVSSEYRNLESTVSGILSGAVGPVAGVDAGDFLPREDEVNENARRLADIMVNGLTGQDWMGEFAAEAPDVYQALVEAGDPQLAAAQILQDFQDGLRPDLLDKDRAKELVKRAILGDQETAALVSEIAGELAQELGISMQEATAAASQVLGAGDAGSGGSGGDLIAGMVAGMDADPIVDSIVAGIAARTQSFFNSGVEGGKQWGAGFMNAVGENVPEPLINLLATLVTPGVMANIDRNAGMTGAGA